LKSKLLAAKLQDKSLGNVPSGDDILHMMLPPREFEDGDQTYVQCVSAQPASRFDVITLQEHLDRRMAERKARESGICVVREQLYAQCFDELIRQVTLNQPERGLLLLRVRDEMKLTISAYQTLYESSVAFSTRKAIQAQDGIGDMKKKLEDLIADCSALEEESVQLTQQLESTKRRENEKTNVLKKKHTEAVEYLMRSNTQLEKAVKQMDPKNAA
jgi:dynein light intermediate chain